MSAVVGTHAGSWTVGWYRIDSGAMDAYRRSVALTEGSTRQGPTLGVFEFIILLVLISTAGKVLSQRIPRERRSEALPGPSVSDVEGIREALDELNNRVVRLEEERDFYKALLESPERRRELRGPAPEDDEADVSGPR